MKAAIHKSAIPDSQIFTVKYLEDKHFDPVWHSHSEYQLFVPLQGTGTLFIGDTIHSFVPNDLVLTGSDLPHLWRSDEVYFEKNNDLFVRGVVIYLQESILGDHLMAKDELVHLRKLFTRAKRGLSFGGKTKDEVILMMLELTRLTGLDAVILLLQILNKLANCKEHTFLSSAEYVGINKKEEADRLSGVYEYILKNYRKKIQLNDLADMLCMTPTSFSRYFTTATNMGFARFISQLRIEYACKLLIDTDLNIAVIAERAGFATMSNFNKQFRELMLKKPTDYRREFLTL